MANLSEVGVNFSTYLVSLSPQIKNNSLQWYLSGSLGTTMMAEAESITEIELDEKNNLIGETTSKEITEEQREKLRKFSRKLGKDIDVVNVNGDLFRGAPSNNKPHIQNVIKNVPDVLDLMSWSPSTGASAWYIDSLEQERKISYHPVARVKTLNGDVYITAPPEQLAHKLSETIWLSSRLAGEKVDDDIKSKYQKDIKDVSSMFYGFKDLYENGEFLARIYQALNEKDGSLFSIHNPIYNSDNAMEGQEILDKYIMRRIIADSREYLRIITGDKSDMELNEFFDSLLDRRKADVEKFSRNQPHHSATPLQQRESELSALETEAKEYDNELETVHIEQEGQDIGE